MPHGLLDEVTLTKGASDPQSDHDQGLVEEPDLLSDDEDEDEEQNEAVENKVPSVTRHSKLYHQVFSASNS